MMIRAATQHRRRGTILIVTMLICFTLASVVLVLCHSMAVESVASANESAGVQADSIEQGAEQYVLGLLTTNSVQPSTVLDTSTYDDSYWDGVQLGHGYFWILRPDYQDSSLPLFGLVDECSKLDLNYATFEQLQTLPGMTDDLAAALADWKNTDINPGGAKDDYYLSLPSPYHCKQAFYESVEESLMVRGMTKQILYGDPGALPLGQTSATDQFGTGASLTDNGALPHGLADVLTVNSYGGANNFRGKINVNTAPRAVFAAMVANGAVIDSTIVDNLISYRQSAVTPGSIDVGWVGQQGGPQTGNARDPNYVGTSATYSADILAVSGNGRGYRRVKMVIATGTAAQIPGSTASAVPRVLYRRDFTSQGWPLDPTVLDQIRAGTFQPGGAVYTDGLSGGTAH